MAASDARPVPKKNVAYRHYFAIRKNDGTLITTWAGQDSEVDKDGAGFADCTNEATEIGTTGVGYLDLTSTEMNADAVNVKITVTNTDALPYVVTLFPEEAGDIRTDVTMLGSDAQSATDLKDFADAGYDPSTNKVQGVVLVDTLTTYTGNTPQTGDTYALANGASGFVATKADTAAILLDTGTDGVVVAAGSKSGYALSSSGMDAVTLPANLITASSIAGDAITSDKVAPSVHQELIELAFTYDATATYAGADAGSLVKQIADNAGGSGLTLGDIADAVWDEDLTGHTTPDSAGEILGNVATGTPPTAAAIADAVWDEATAGHTTSGTFGEQLKTDVDAILADTNELQTNQGNWLTATGFSTHSAADVWAVATRVLTAGTNIQLPANGLANITAWTVDVTGSLSGSVGSVTGAVGSVTGNVGGNVAGSVGSVTGAVGSVTGNVGGIAGTITTLDALDTAQDSQHSTTQSAISGLNNISAADVNAQVLDVLNVDTFAEPTGVPPATTTLRNMLGFVYSFLFRNKITVTASKMTFHGDDDAAEFEKDVSDDGTTYTESETNSI